MAASPKLSLDHPLFASFSHSLFFFYHLNSGTARCAVKGDLVRCRVEHDRQRQPMELAGSAARAECSAEGVAVCVSRPAIILCTYAWLARLITYCVLVPAHEYVSRVSLVES